jgi:DNA end-binding protein Ku
VARAIWKGIITLKSIKVPVKLYSAIQPKDIHFNLLHDEDLERVKGSFPRIYHERDGD